MAQKNNRHTFAAQAQSGARFGAPVAAFALSLAAAATPAAAGWDHTPAVRAVVENGLRAQIASAPAVDALRGRAVAFAPGVSPTAAVSDPIASKLRVAKDAFGGLVTEIVVFDARGAVLAHVGGAAPQPANVRIGAAVAGEVVVHPVAFDAHAELMESRVSFPIADALGVPVGAAVVGVNVEMLP